MICTLFEVDQSIAGTQHYSETTSSQAISLDIIVQSDSYEATEIIVMILRMVHPLRARLKPCIVNSTYTIQPTITDRDGTAGLSRRSGNGNEGSSLPLRVRVESLDHR